jgi:hypothetical protein
VKTAGVVSLIALLAVLGASVAPLRAGRTNWVRPDVAGVIELFGDGTIVVETATAGLREVRVDGSTVVRELTAQSSIRDGDLAGAVATLAGLRPGRFAIMSVRPGPGALAVAREIGVWGEGR